MSKKESAKSVVREIRQEPKRLT